ncbi:MAG: hypothetical protein KDB80_12415 [Planctomycetes bacterium]|nr:hypothetical protein [Planctomycetota bacterium]
MDLLRPEPQPSIVLAEGARCRRSRVDRRRQPTPILSTYTFFGGRRRLVRRDEEDGRVFVDQWGAGLFLVVSCVAALNFLDAWFTILLLSFGGKEMNPFIDAVLQMGFWPFIFVKSLGIGTCVAILTLTSRFGIAKVGLGTVLMGYSMLLCWHLVLMERVPF